jgi:hypothetical protein
VTELAPLAALEELLLADPAALAAAAMLDRRLAQRVLGVGVLVSKAKVLVSSNAKNRRKV